MKQLVYTTIFLSLTIAVVASCGPKSASVANDNVLPLVAIPTSTPETIQPTPASSSDMATIRKYAESYEPKSGREVIPSPPVPNEKVLKIISDLANSKSREHEKYIVLIFLRLDRFQTEHFKQTYELGRENPLTKEFYRLFDNYAYPNAEFNPAHLASLYVRKHPELLKYPLIEAEMKRIEKAGEKIERELNDTIKKQAAKSRSN